MEIGIGAGGGKMGAHFVPVDSQPARREGGSTERQQIPSTEEQHARARMAPASLLGPCRERRYGQNPAGPDHGPCVVDFVDAPVPFTNRFSTLTIANKNRDRPVLV